MGIPTVRHWARTHGISPPKLLIPLSYAAERRERGPLLEMEVGEGSPVAGRTVEDAGLETLPGHSLLRLQREDDAYGPVGATVTGVRRGGEHVKKPLREIVLRPGDVLVLETGRGFRHACEEIPDFFITSEAGAAGEREMDVEREPEAPGIPVAVAILVAVVGAAAVGLTHIAVAARLGAFAMVVLGLSYARRGAGGGRLVRARGDRGSARRAGPWR